MSGPSIRRAFAMPSPNTFEMVPVAELLDRWLVKETCVVDPFCGRSRRAHFGNDIIHGGIDAIEWLQGLMEDGVRATAVLLDPPYSPRQIAEHYREAGRTPTRADTQNARLYRRAREALDAILAPGGLAVSCGWSSTGFGERMGYELLEVLLVHHGGAHHDTIVLVEQKRTEEATRSGAAEGHLEALSEARAAAQGEEK